MRAGDEMPEAGFTLLANAKPAKGFDLLLEVAGRCPEIVFVAIASQSDPDVARRAIKAKRLDNVRILTRTDNMAALYESAHVVLVPSFRFLETFSRVCIEAHRFGRPVIGAAAGNVPFLLRSSGVVLAESAADWSDELKLMYEDSAYYAERCRLALENSARYSQSSQRRALNNVLDSAAAPLLVGIGSGIGNMLHTGPMIRNLARTLGHPVDLVVSEDHAGSLFLLHREDFVRSVFSLRPPVMERHYERVFLTNCFGDVRLNFSADQIFWSRDWQRFTPGGSLHETIFNLEAAKALLGIAYGPEDIDKHYIADFDYQWSDGTRVGFHAGSKDGHWTSKRWGRFPELAEVLKDRGLSVASFGKSEEYVPGTEDLTGGSIEEMARAMCTCSYFVSNDSGLMNIANALGIPVLGIFGPTDVGTRGPMSPLSATVAVRRDCAPCEVKNPKFFKGGDCRCIQELSVEQVLESFDKLQAAARGAVADSGGRPC